MSEPNPFLALAPNLKTQTDVGSDQAPGGGSPIPADISALKTVDHPSATQNQSSSKAEGSLCDGNDPSGSSPSRYDEKQIGVHNLLIWITRTVVDREFRLKPTQIPPQKLMCSVKKCAVLPDNEENFKTNHRLLTLDNIDVVVFERMMTNFGPDGSNHENTVTFEIHGYRDDFAKYDTLKFNPCETRILHYLYACFARLQAVRKSPFLDEDQVKKLESVFITQASLYLCNPYLDSTYDEQEFKGSKNPIFSLLMEYHNKNESLDHHDILKKFLGLLATDIHNKEVKGDEGEVHLTAIIRPAVENLAAQFSKISLMEVMGTSYFRVLDILLANEHLSKSVVEANFPAHSTEQQYLKTLFCRILSISCLPNETKKDYEFFLNPSTSLPSEVEITENQIGTVSLPNLNDLMNRSTIVS